MGSKNKRTCTICNKPIHLVPSATERAKKFGGEPSYYLGLFTAHADCIIAKRNQEAEELIQRKSHDSG